MKRRILNLVLSVILVIQLLSGVVEAAYFVGPMEYILNDKYLDFVQDASVSGEKVVLKAGGTATFGFYLPFNAESITLTFKGTPSPITVSNGTQNYLADPGESLEYKLVLDPYERIGEKVYTFTAEKAVTLSKVSFNVASELCEYATAEKAPNISDEEFMLQNAIIIRTDCPMIIVNGGRRYINLDNQSETPIYINGSVYLPIHTLARALSLYYEDLPDKKYVLLRSESDELVFTDEFSYKNDDDGNKIAIDNIVHYIDGKTYLPVRYVAEFYGRRVGYKDGMIAIDDNKYYVDDFLDSDTSVHALIVEKFEEIMSQQNSGKTYYVAKTSNASDDNPGTYDAPFKTITKAGQVAVAGDTVIVREGTYRETVTVKNNGTPSAPIKFKAADGEKVVISATEQITEFKPYGDNMAVAGFPYDMGYGKNQLFYDEKTITEARYPNGPLLDLGGDNEPLSDNWPVLAPLYTDDDNDLHVTNEELLNQPEGTWDGATFICLRGYAYATSFAQIKHSKPGELDLTNPGVYYWDKGNPNDAMRWGYINGARAAIDMPGEWAVQNDTLFIMPPEGTNVDDLVVEAKARQLVVDIPDNKCIQFEGFTTIGGSMRLNNSELCVIKDCTIKYNNHYTYSKDQHTGFIDDANVMDDNGAPSRGEVGLYVGGIDNIFVDNIFDEAAAAAIYGVGRYTYIENNLIKNCGYGGSYVAGLNFNGEAWKGSDYPRGGMVIVGNTVYNAGRSPLQTTRPAGKGEWAIMPYEVAFNDFHNGMLTSLDTGIVYTYMSDHGNNRKKTQMHHNLIYYTPDWTNEYSFGLYHDGGTINIDTYNNLVFCTEEGVKLTNYPYIKTHIHAGSTNQTDVWNNACIQRAVKGGRDGLVPSDYPDGMMFDAGSNIGRAPYTKNYEMIINNSPELNVVNGYVSAKDAELGEGVERIGSDVRLDKKGEWLKFPNVDFGAGGNQLTVHFKGDRYKTPPNLDIIIDDLENGKVYPNLIIYSRGRTTDDKNVLHKYTYNYTGKHDIYVRMRTETAAVDISGIIATRDPLFETDTSEDGSIIYGGNFTDCSTPKASLSPKAGYGAMGDEGNPFVNNTWPGTHFVYEDVEIKNISDMATINYCTGAGYGGQKMQIRIGSIDAEPIAEFVSGEPGWSVWTDVTVPLNKILEPGTYDFYVTFFDDQEAKNSTMNLYYIKFGNGVEERAKANTIYGGNLTEFTASPQGELAPLVQYGANSDENNPFVNNTWPGTILVYENCEIKNDVKKVIVNHCTADKYSGQNVQIRLDSPTSTPIAEFVTQNTGWGNWTDFEVSLRKDLAAGTYDIYVTFEEPDGKYAEKTANFYYYRFSE